MPIKYAQVNDIQIAYQVFGKGFPLLLIMGYGGTMDIWDSRLLNALANNYQVIIFDNRGMGLSTATGQKFSIPLFAADTVELLKALKISQAHILGYSMGAQIALELTLKYPAMVDKLVLYAGSCGGKEAVAPDPEVVLTLTDTAGTPEEIAYRLIPILLPEKWREENPDYIQNLPKVTETALPEIIDRQTDAFLGWEGCYEKLSQIFLPALILTGTEDVIIPPENSLVLAEHISNSKLVRISGGGHGMMYQYPEKISQSILEFLGKGG